MLQAVKCAVGNVDKRRSNLESLFCYDKPIPEEIIEEPIGISLAEKDIGYNPHCPNCESKGDILCTTCSGSGLYVESILESRGIIVKVRCLGKKKIIRLSITPHPYILPFFFFSFFPLSLNFITCD
ncbi:hypothetical protein PHJA_000590200 [Phtheirospermum japonicum]|uniref:Uncharacterized protein n=1 Tax=Phtheirospermum japonicum TaxID=374723 RepID=A0A830BKA8_9LAMI|nr:hypothetical protein PHJA_000590200 [Phtheirospermum japonicum]